MTADDVLVLAGVVRTTSDGPLRWVAAPPAWACVLLAAALVLAIRAIYRRERVRPSLPTRLLLVGLRILAVAVVALALFRPEREIVRKAEERSRLVVLLDASASMLTKDRYRPETERAILDALWPDDGGEARPAALDATRLDLVARAIAGRGEPFLRALAERFDVDVLAFDQEIRPLASTAPGPAVADAAARGAGDVPSDLVAAAGEAVRTANRPTGAEKTDLAGALRAIAREYLGRDDRRLAGVVLVTDGRDTSGEKSAAEALASLGRAAEELRVVAVALGDPSLARDLRVDRVQAKDVILVNDQAAFAADLRHTGFEGVAGVRVALEIRRIADAADRPVAPGRARESLAQDAGRDAAVTTLGAESAATTVVLRATFPEAGTFDVAVRATLPPSHAPQDAVSEDDVKHHVIRVKDMRIRVLLADEVLRHESWFLKNVLVRERTRQGDPRRLEAQVFVRTFDPDVPQPRGPGVPPLRTFPSTRQEIFSYDVIVLGDIDWRRLGADERASKEILGLIREFVAEGGGVAFVAGTERSPDRFLDTPLQDLLPVDVSVQDRERRSDDPFDASSPTVPFRLAPTDLGANHPILALDHDGAKPSAIWGKAEGWEWYWLYRARGGVKPGAQALARVDPGVVGERARRWFLDDRGDPFVVFAATGYGKGRTFFSAIDDIYRIRKENGDAYYGAFWDETIRWLATYRLLGGNRRFKIEAPETCFVGETVVVKVSALDADFRPLDVPELPGFALEDPTGRALPLAPGETPRRDPESGPGTYRTAIRLPASGTWTFTLSPPTGAAEGRAERRIEVLFATEEARDRTPDHVGLEALVRAANPPGTAPRVVRISDVLALPATLPAFTTERVLDRRQEPVWDSSWVLWVVAALLAAEWILRKRLRMV